MPRVQKGRTSLPSHSKAPRKALPPSAAITTADGGDDDFMDDDQGDLPEQSAFADEAEVAQEESQRPPPKPKAANKAEKAYNKRKALLDKLQASASPYSKSHSRRVRRAAKPENNLVASLDEVEAFLPDVEPLRRVEDGEDEEGMEDDEGEEVQTVVPGTEKRKDGKGVEKLTAKKRNRVLTAESARLPAIIKNSTFAASPFATIRQHTLNTLVTQKNPPSAMPVPRKRK